MDLISREGMNGYYNFTTASSVAKQLQAVGIYLVNRALAKLCSKIAVDIQLFTQYLGGSFNHILVFIFF